jgi:hypothetical protein
VDPIHLGAAHDQRPDRSAPRIPDRPHGLEQAGRPGSVHVERRQRFLQRDRDEGLTGEMDDPLRPRSLQELVDTDGIGEVQEQARHRIPGTACGHDLVAAGH